MVADLIVRIRPIADVQAEWRPWYVTYYFLIARKTMPSSYSTSDLLSLFDGMYQSVDIRWVAARNKDQWLLVAMSVHVSVESGEFASKAFHEDLKRIPEFELSAIRIFQRSYPVEEVHKLAQMLLSGGLVLDGMEFTLSDRRNILTQIGYIRPAESDGLTSEWPRWCQEMKLHSDHSATQIFLNDFQFCRATELAGYKSPEAAVSHLLGVGFSSNSVGGFWLTVDVPIRMLALAVSRKGDKLILNVPVEAHPAIHDVSCVTRIKATDRRERNLPISKLSRLPGDGNVALWYAEIPLILQRGELLEIDVLCDQAGRLYSMHEWAHKLLPIEIANPLFAALTMFCPADKLLSHFTQPETLKPSKRVKQDHQGSLFEISVQWLLSVLGFQALWLHGYEIFREGDVQIGTVDCLAYSEHENLLLLVNCSLGAPDPAELNQHAAFCARISKHFSVISNVKVLAVLVTATLAPEGRHTDTSVVILYKSDLETLLKSAESGLHVEFSNYTNPIFRGQSI
jgi:hypothetical protein